MSKLVLVENKLGTFLIHKEYVERARQGVILGDAGELSVGNILSSHVVSAGKKYLRKDSIFLDIGGYMGSIAIALGRHLSSLGGGKVISVEANPSNFECLKYNITENIPNNVEKEAIHAVCLKRSKKEAQFPNYTAEQALQEGRLMGQFGVKDVKDTTPLCEISGISVDDLGLQDVSLIKIDAEGEDYSVLEGAKDTIKRNAPAIIFENNGKGSSFDEFVMFFKPLGYEIERISNKNDFLATRRGR